MSRISIISLFIVLALFTPLTAPMLHEAEYVADVKAFLDSTEWLRTTIKQKNKIILHCVNEGEFIYYADKQRFRIKCKRI